MRVAKVQKIKMKTKQMPKKLFIEFLINDQFNLINLICLLEIPHTILIIHFVLEISMIQPASQPATKYLLKAGIHKKLKLMVNVCQNWLLLR